MSWVSTERTEPNKYVKASVVYVSFKERNTIPRAKAKEKNTPINASLLNSLFSLKYAIISAIRIVKGIAINSGCVSSKMPRATPPKAE